MDGQAWPRVVDPMGGGSGGVMTHIGRFFLWGGQGVNFL